MIILRVIFRQTTLDFLLFGLKHMRFNIEGIVDVGSH